MGLWGGGVNNNNISYNIIMSFIVRYIYIYFFLTLLLYQTKNKLTFVAIPCLDHMHCDPGKYMYRLRKKLTDVERTFNNNDKNNPMHRRGCMVPVGGLDRRAGGRQVVVTGRPGVIRVVVVAEGRPTTSRSRIDRRRACSQVWPRRAFFYGAPSDSNFIDS